jgi:hypothetical protein
MKRAYVSDHALLRYIERVRGIDIDRLRGELADKVQGAVNLGAASYAVDGVTFRLIDNRIVTIIDSKSSHSARINAGRKTGKAKRVQR